MRFDKAFLETEARSEVDRRSRLREEMDREIDDYLLRQEGSR